MSEIRAIRGMGDILPADTPVWRAVEATVAATLTSYGYSEIRMPILEKTALFKRSIGEVTDIVEKEMYTFEDRNGDSLTLRPEGTAGCVRAVIQEGLINATRRLWYGGPMFRHERPQKGRQRQFHQIGVEVFGIATPDIDAELIVLSNRLWKALGINEGLQLQINSIGSPAARAAYRDALVTYLGQYRDALDEDSQRRLESNPLRILDSKNEKTQSILRDAPSLEQYLDAESAQDFADLRRLLDAVGIDYVVNRSLVRGLDYYNKTVFEWVTDRLGAQGTVCAGGRYDSLVGQLGGKPTPAVGFALGMERLVLLLQEQGAGSALEEPSVYVVAAGEEAQQQALVTVERLRDQFPQLAIVVHAGGGSFRSQMKKADKSGARIALIWGTDEVSNATVTVKALRGQARQQTIALSELGHFVSGSAALTD